MVLWMVFCIAGVKTLVFKLFISHAYWQLWVRISWHSTQKCLQIAGPKCVVFVTMRSIFQPLVHHDRKELVAI